MSNEQIITIMITKMIKVYNENNFSNIEAGTQDSSQSDQENNMIVCENLVKFYKTKETEVVALGT